MLPLTVTRKSGEAAKYLAALAAHELSVEQHYEALEKARPMLGRFNFPQWSALRFEAEALAERDGCPHPRYLRKPAPPPEAERDPLDSARRASMRRAPLAKDELLDQVLGRTGEDEQQRRAERERHTADAPPVEDKLAAFRDQSPPGMPPAWVDS